MATRVSGNGKLPLKMPPDHSSEVENPDELWMCVCVCVSVRACVFVRPSKERAGDTSYRCIAPSWCAATHRIAMRRTSNDSSTSG